MNPFRQFRRFFAHFRHPFSLPEDLAKDLGISLPNRLNFEGCVARLKKGCTPKTLRKYMPRHEAERAFLLAEKKDCFPRTTTFAYNLDGMWIEIHLTYDHEARLRRVYLQYHGNPADQGIELPLEPETCTF